MKVETLQQPSVIQDTPAETPTDPGAGTTIVDPAYDLDAIREALERYGRSLDATIDTLVMNRRIVDSLLAEVDRPAQLRDFFSGSTNGDRKALTNAMAALEESRRNARYQLFQALLAEGSSVGDISRIWGISRQLASRILREGRATATD